MSKPKNMTPEQEAAWREKKAAMDKAYREANREKVAAYENAYHEANREKVAARQKSWREANREKVAAMGKRHSENLTQSYVASILRTPISECPPELIELKRQQLMLARMTRKLKEEINHA